jgi:hypothetical protein
VERVEQYRKNAEDCRALAQGARTANEREALLKMADMWMALAGERKAKISSEEIQ